DMDGFELMKLLRDRHALKGIALTGYGMEADISRASDAGFVAHLTKPISVKVLERALAVALPSQATLENIPS
ncbi:MAG TPA: response regulator, partial [Opitutus sp.]|nr:response regulator [Opitutus sp.]